MKHLKVLGSIAYAYVPATTRTKLDNRAEKKMLVVYKQGGYKLYNLMAKKVIVSRDVTFAKDEAWSWSVHVDHDPQKQVVYVLDEEHVAIEVPTEIVAESSHFVTSVTSYNTY